MNTLICCIAKNENKYIREWVEWYKKIGVTNICLFDNNDTNGESFSDVIGDYIGSGFVIVKDVRGMEKMQIPCYQICYNEYNKKYDWIGFFDADEFLEIEEGTIEDFLNKDIYKNAEGIRVCWKNYDDNDLIKVEGDNYSINRFTRIMDENSIENKISKIILKGGLSNIEFYPHPGGEHGILIKCKVVDCYGRPHNNSSFLLSQRIWANAWLNHYRYKTLEEFATIKIKRGYPNMGEESAKKMLNFDSFWTYNKKTKEKEEYLLTLMNNKSEI